MLYTDFKVIHTMSWGYMNTTGVLCCYEVCKIYIMLKTCLFWDLVCKRMLIFQCRKILAQHGIQYLKVRIPAFLEHIFDKC